MTVHDRYNAAAAVLAGQGITVVLNTTALSAGDAWTDATTQHGRRVAVAHEYGASWYSPNELRYRDGHRACTVKTLWFGFPFDDVTVGQAVADAFTGQGFAVEWDGSPEQSVIVHLGN